MGDNDDPLPLRTTTLNVIPSTCRPINQERGMEGGGVDADVAPLREALERASVGGSTYKVYAGSGRNDWSV